MSCDFFSQDGTETPCRCLLKSQCEIGSSLAGGSEPSVFFQSNGAVSVFRGPQITTAFPDTCRGTLLKNDAGVIAFNAGIGACAEGCRQLRPEKRRKVRPLRYLDLFIWTCPSCLAEQPSSHHVQICQSSLQALKLKTTTHLYFKVIRLLLSLCVLIWTLNLLQVLQQPTLFGSMSMM